MAPPRLELYIHSGGCQHRCAARCLIAEGDVQDAGLGLADSGKGVGDGEESVGGSVRDDAGNTADDGRECWRTADTSAKRCAGDE